MPEHSVITDPEIHEPKGASTASSGMVYVADGLGSGAWEFDPHGWGYYQHDGADQVFNTTPSKIVIDGASSFTDEQYLPKGILGSGSLWDVVGNVITPINLGDTYTCRVNLPVTAKSGNPNYITLILDIGGGTSVTVNIAELDKQVIKSVPFTLSFTLPIFCKETFLANGGAIFVSTDVGSLTVAGANIFISKTGGS